MGAMTRLTPEVPFPEIETWPTTYFTNPYPLSEEHYLVAWSDEPLENKGCEAGEAELGIYLFDAFGNLELVYRDPTIACMYPMPIRARTRPPALSSPADWDGPQEGRMAVVDVYRGLGSIPRGTVRSLRLVGVPAKDHPRMNAPVMGVTRHDPGKFVLGTVPVEKDGSAHFRVPSGVPFFLQALDGRGRAVQTMRSVTYVQPGEEQTCVGCHEPRNTAPPNLATIAARRDPSPITPGPEGAWPIDYDVLVEPIVQARCAGCHKPGAEGHEFDLTPEKSYDALVNFGEPSLKNHVTTRHRQGRSTPGGCASGTSPLVRLLEGGHYDVELSRDEWQRLFTWMDTYAQRRGAFSEDQHQRLEALRRRTASLLTPGAGR
jgi:hypothetical protein